MKLQTLARNLLAAACAAGAVAVLAQPAGAPPTRAEVLQSIETQLPSPQAGATWKLFRNVVFQKPADWKEHERTGSIGPIPTFTWAASAEDFSPTKYFEMGITVQIIDGSARNMKSAARTIATALLHPILRSHKPEEILIQSQRVHGDNETTILRYKDAPPGLTPIIVHRYTIANDTTDTVHIFVFESPEATWDANWAKYGTLFLSRINVVPGMPAN